MKLGAWQENLKGVTDSSIPSILNYYNQATEYDPDWYKAWHSWAYMNFETVLFYKNKEETEKAKNEKNVTNQVDVNKHTVEAIKGFFK